MAPGVLQSRSGASSGRKADSGVDGGGLSLHKWQQDKLARGLKDERAGAIRNCCDARRAGASRPLAPGFALPLRRRQAA